MRAIRIIILVAGMAALLAGCQNGCDQGGISRPEGSYFGRVIDSPAGLPLAPSRGGMGTPSQRGTDSLEEYYERMERWRVLHGGMSKWESDK